MTWANIVVALSMVIVGILSRVIRPSAPNPFMGYRTKRSRASEDTWKYANRLLPNYMLWLSLVAICIQVFCYFIFSPLWGITASISVFTLGLLLSVITIESSIKRKFNADGTLKNKNRSTVD